MIAQIAAITIFVVMFILIITEKIEKHYVTLGSGLLTLIVVFGICLKDFGAMWDIVNLKSIVTAWTGRPSSSSAV